MRAMLAVLALAACAHRPTLRDPHAGQLSVTFHNESGTSVCALHLWPTSATDKGANAVPASTEVPSGGTLQVWVPVEDPPRAYQLEVYGCPYEKVQVAGFAASMLMTIDAHAILFDEGNPTSKTSAGELAHAHENTALVPGKFSRLAHPQGRPAGVIRARGGR